jgi:hypothetical protein
MLVLAKWTLKCQYEIVKNNLHEKYLLSLTWTVLGRCLHLYRRIKLDRIICTKQGYLEKKSPAQVTHSNKLSKYITSFFYSTGNRASWIKICNFCECQNTFCSHGYYENMFSVIMVPMIFSQGKVTGLDL